MVGYSDYKEVAIWIQTKAQHEVKFKYHPVNNASEVRWTKALNTKKDNAFTATLIADSVQPGTKYIYQVFVDGKIVELNRELKFQTQTLWQWRTDPPNFKFATGSCVYVNDSSTDRPGKPYGGNYEIFESDCLNN